MSYILTNGVINQHTDKQSQRKLIIIPNFLHHFQFKIQEIAPKWKKICPKSDVICTKKFEMVSGTIFVEQFM